MGRSFWLQLYSASVGVQLACDSPSSRITCLHPFATEGAVLFPTETVIPANSNVEQITPANTDKRTNTSERKAVETIKKEQDLHSWEAVAQGVNYVVSAIYLFSNVLLFAICMFALLLRLFDHASDTCYLIKPSDTCYLIKPSDTSLI